MTIRGQDNFTRANQSGLGTASDTQVWTQALGTTPASIASNQGKLTGGSNSVNNIFTLGTVQQADIDIVMHFDGSASADNVGPAGRIQNTTNYYRATYNAGQLFLTKVSGGTATDLQVLGVSTPSAGFYIHLYIKGNSINNLRASFWLDGEADGDEGQVVATDSTITAVGNFGFRARISNAADVITFDSFLAQDPAATSFPAPPSPFPFSNQGMTLYVPGANPTLLEQQTITDLTGIQAGAWIRYQAKWKNIEPNADGVYIWTYMDYAVSLCNSYGVNICWPVQSPPTAYLTIKATDGSTVSAGTGDYASPAQWATFMTAIANRYSGAVTSPVSGYPMILSAIGLENEDYDSSQPGVGNNQPARDILSKWLVLALNAVYPALRNNGFVGRIVINAVRKTPNNALTHITNWLTNLMTYSGGPLAAILADPLVCQDFHAYYDGRTNADGSSQQDPTQSTYDALGNINAPSVQLQLATMRRILASYGAVWKVWCGETGWDLYNSKQDVYKSDTATISAALDSFYRQEMLDALRTGGAEVCCQFTISPTATVSFKTIPNSPTDATTSSVAESSAIKSITQIISGTYTYLAAYAMLQAYAISYPLWSTSATVAASSSMIDLHTQKQQIVKVYDPSGTAFLGIWQDAPLLTGYKTVVNAAQSPVKMTLPRKIDAFDGAGQSNTNLTIWGQFKWGQGIWGKSISNTVVAGNNVKIYLYGPGLPATGFLKFNGFIDTIEPTLTDKGDESVTVTLVPYSAAMGDHGYPGIHTFSNVDPITMFNYFFNTVDGTSGLGGVHYTNPLTLDGSNPASSGTTVSYVVQYQDLKSIFDVVLVMLGMATWYYRPNVDNTVTLTQIATTAQHELFLGQHLASLSYSTDNSQRKNVIVFVGNGVTATAVGASALPPSQGGIGERILFRQDSRISDSGTAQVYANALLKFYDQPLVRTKCRVFDYRGDSRTTLGYDIESLREGDTIIIRDTTSKTKPTVWGQFLWGQAGWGNSGGTAFNVIAPIVSVNYGFFFVDLEIGNFSPSQDRSLFQIAKRLQDFTVAP